MSELSAGTMTFVFTDVQGSTRHWETDPGSMRLAMEQHDAIAKSVVEQHCGNLVKSRSEGDSLFVVFDHATNAVSAALALQCAFADHAWPTAEPIKVRIAIGTSDAALHDHDYYGNHINRFARLRTIGHGGQILLAKSTRDLIGDKLPDGANLIYLGDYQLADLTLPEHVYQLSMSGLATEFPPLRSLSILPNNLPRQTTSFVGREKEIAEIKRLLAEHVLVTVTGSAGVGKSRISFQVAADLLPEVPDGVWGAELSGVATGGQAQTHIAAAVGAGGADPIESLVEAVGHKKLILVINNCGHVITGVRTLVQMVLQRCPNLRILATSRERLDLPCEVVYRLPSLSVPDLHHLLPLQNLTDFESIRLFLRRAQLVDTSFQITRSNAAAVAEICSRLDGIPLAIELAASRINVLAPSEINKRLNRRFKLLTGGSRVAMPRQQTLLAAIEWGYDLLAPSLKQLLSRLSVFVDGWTLDAAKRVCCDEPTPEAEVLEMLTNLVEKSIVVSYNDQFNCLRYGMLQSIRQFAHEKLEATGDLPALRERHADYYVRVTQEVGRRLNEMEEASIGAQHTRMERGNICAAIEQICASDAEEVDGVCRACSIYQAFDWDWAAVIGDARRYFELIRSRHSRIPRCECAIAFSSYAKHLSRAGDSAASCVRAAEDAIEICRAVDVPLSLYDSLQVCASALEKLGRPTEAGERLIEACVVAERLDSNKLRAEILGAAADQLWVRGQYKPGLRAKLQEMASLSEVSNYPWSAQDLRQVGQLHYMLGDFQQARHAYLRADSYFAMQDDHKAILLRCSADLYCAVGQYADAWRDLRASYELSAALCGGQILIAASYESGALLHASESVYVAAALLLGAANEKRAKLRSLRIVPEQQEYDKLAALIVSGLGESECARLIAEGEKLTDDQATELMTRQAPPTAEQEAFDDL